jgi:hypothetical protein
MIKVFLEVPLANMVNKSKATKFGGIFDDSIILRIFPIELV